MSRPPVEEPKVTERESGGGKASTITHPAYAVIGASRVSGHANLFQSDFSHRAYVAIRIRRAEINRELSHDWVHGRGEIIEVAMSEAQWATLVSSMNVGDGVPCTLQHINHETVPELPDPPARAAQFAGEVRAKLDESHAALKTLLGEIEGLNLPKAKAQAIRQLVERAVMQLGSNIPYVAKSFDQHTERTVERAKAEIHGYMTGIAIRHGLEALAGSGPLMIAAPADDDGEAV